MALSDLEVVFHSKVAERIGCLSKLWYVCRAISDNGKAIFSINEVSNALSVTEKTVRDWLYRGKQANLFRSYTRNKDSVTVYFSSLFTVCKEYGIDNFGASAVILVNHLKDYKVMATEITIQALQASSIYAAKQSHVNAGYKNFYQKYKKPEQLIDLKNTLSSSSEVTDSTSELCTGVNGIMELNKKFGKVSTLLTDYSFLSYGCSQQSVANRLGVHLNTIKNRMRKSDVDKVRLAISNKDNYIEREVLKEEYSTDTGKFFTVKGVLYKLCTYIYEPVHTLKSLRRRRSEFKQISV